MTQDTVSGISGIVGSSRQSIDDAIRQAIEKASENRRHMRWFEVHRITGHIVDQQVEHFQVELKIGYGLED